ncbi:protein HGV2-like isoform X1 [Tubulanus polymorphus]|uniref:protein HGV2-like isoform X1 n=1 Tax=Tubulanus polymorphus TaxID=672921 RepID=UPI003DA62CB9
MANEKAETAPESVEPPVETTESTEKDSANDKQKVIENAEELLAQGKRNLLCGEIAKSVNDLQEASRLLGECYGEIAEECAEAYFFYGKALLELVRMEPGVIGNALKGVPEDDETEEEDVTESDEPPKVPKVKNIANEEREKIADDVIDAMLEKDPEVQTKEENGDKTTEESADTAEKSDEKQDEEISEVTGEKQAETKETTEKSDEKKVELSTEKSDDKQDEKMSETDETPAEVSSDKSAEKPNPDADTVAEAEGKEEDKPENEDEKSQNGDDDKSQDEEGDEEMDAEEDEDKDKEEDDVSNVQVAWEMLDLARVIYLKKDDKEHALKAAQAHLKLGELSIETENCERAIEDLKECLRIQEKYLEPNDRLLAETNYQLGLAMCFHGLYDESIDAYRSAVKVIEGKIDALTKTVEENKFDKDSDKAAVEQEIKELKDILPDVKAKIEDAVEEKKNFAELKTKALEAVGGGAEVSIGFGESSTASTSEISTISVKRNNDEAKPDNISHLVRKKRKPEDGAEDEADVKKAKQENGTNGVANGSSNGVSNGKSNGHADGGDGDKKEVVPEKIVAKKLEDVKESQAEEKMVTETSG